MNHEIFAFCLAEWGGLLTVGGYDPSFVVPGHRLQWLPMHAAGYFGVTLQKLSCGLQVGLPTSSFSGPDADETRMGC